MLHKRAFQAFLLCSFVCILAACTSGTGTSPASSSPRATPTVAVTPSPTMAPGTVLFQANWSQGLSGWSGTQGWTIVQGQLEVNSGSSATLAIPYRPVVSNYAIEVRLQVVRLLQDHGGSFVFAAAKQKGKDGYQAGVLDLKKPGPFGSHPQAQALIDPYNDMSQGCCQPIDYEPGYEWHTYRIEVRDNEVRLLDDGTQIAHADSNATDTLSNGPLSLNSSLVVLRISSLSITAL
jgi:hypothetical protein